MWGLHIMLEHQKTSIMSNQQPVRDERVHVYITDQEILQQTQLAPSGCM